MDFTHQFILIDKVLQKFLFLHRDVRFYDQSHSFPDDQMAWTASYKTVHGCGLQVFFFLFN